MRKTEREKLAVESRQQQAKAKADLQAMWKKLEDAALADAQQVTAGNLGQFVRSDHVHTPLPGVAVHTPWGSGRALTWGSLTWGSSTSAARIYINTMNDTMPKKKLPRSKETMPILAHRAAMLRATAKGIRLFSLSHGPLEIEADAQCRCSNISTLLHLSRPALAVVARTDKIRPQHAEVPADRGTCGFYAVPADVDAMHSANTVDLLVELSGKVVEHEYGYRAGHQRILEARVMRDCASCDKDPEFLCFDTSGFEGFWPLCKDDVGMSKELGVTHIVSLARLSEIIGVPLAPMPK